MILLRVSAIPVVNLQTRFTTMLAIPTKYLLFKWDTMANAQKFAQSAELRAAMEKAGVEGMPVITFLNEA